MRAGLRRGPPCPGWAAEACLAAAPRGPTPWPEAGSRSQCAFCCGSRAPPLPCCGRPITPEGASRSFSSAVGLGAGPCAQGRRRPARASSRLCTSETRRHLCRKAVGSSLGLKPGARPSRCSCEEPRLRDAVALFSASCVGASGLCLSGNPAGRVPGEMLTRPRWPSRWRQGLRPLAWACSAGGPGGS